MHPTFWELVWLILLLNLCTFLLATARTLILVKKYPHNYEKYYHQCRIAYFITQAMTLLLCLISSIYLFFDTMIGGHMVDENVISKSLDWMCKFYEVDEGKQMHPLMRSIIDTWGWYHVPYALLYGYATHDALITMKLFQKILPMYEEQFGPLWSSTS